MSGAPPQNLVLAVYPHARGFGFVFFEGPDSPFEWGIKEIREKRGRAGKELEEIKKLIDRFRPEVLLIEDTTTGGSHPATRIRKLYRMLAHLAQGECIELNRCSKTEVRKCFSLIGAKTKQEIARSIAVRLPAFTNRLPPKRESWMGSDPRQSLFDAAALAVAYYHRPQQEF